MMMMVLVSKQHKVTTKYKMQATWHFSLICQSGEDIIQKCRASRFYCRASGVQVTCIAGRVAVETIFEGWFYTHFLFFRNCGRQLIFYRL